MGKDKGSVVQQFSECTDLLLSKSSVPTATLLVDTLRMQRSRMDDLKEDQDRQEQDQSSYHLNMVQI